MQVIIDNYRVIPAEKKVIVDLTVDVPTGRVNTAVILSEATLDQVASIENRIAWEEKDIVKVVSGFFQQLSSNVTV
jgi:hypothetical protein